MGPWRHVTRAGPTGGTVTPVSTTWGHKGGTKAPHHEHTGQTIYDDLVSMISDVVSIFVTILRAKAPSLVNYDEATHFVIE